MNYYQKYLKYQKKYQNLIGGTFGEVINIPTLESVEDNTFLNNYREIPNSGQQNCGIFISDIYKDKLHINNYMIEKRYALPYDGKAKTNPRSWTNYFEKGEI